MSNLPFFISEEKEWELQVRRAVVDTLEGTLLPYSVELRNREKIYNQIILDIVMAVRLARPTLGEDYNG